MFGLQGVMQDFDFGWGKLETRGWYPKSNMELNIRQKLGGSGAKPPKFFKDFQKSPTKTF